MIPIESILYGLLGGLVGLKIFLLGLAAVLFILSLTEHTRQRTMASARAPVRRPKLDVHA
jgi:hypothetical protein